MNMKCNQKYNLCDENPTDCHFELKTFDIPFYNFVIMHKIQNHVGIEGIQVTES